MKSIHHISLWAFLAICAFTAHYATGAPKITPPDRFFPIYDYQNDWLVYNDQYKNYVPYSQGVNEASRHVSLLVDLLKNRRYYLLVQAAGESYLFVEGALQTRLSANEWQELSIDSLYKIYKRDELLITIYGNPGIEDKSVLLCNKKSLGDTGKDTNVRSSFINIKPITFSPFGNFAVFALILILILSAWIFNLNPLSFIRLINPMEFFNSDPREQVSKINKPYSNTIIFFAVISAMMVGFILMFFSSNRIDVFSVNTILSEKETTWHMLADFFILSTIFFILTYAKYIFMVIAGNMLNLDKQVDMLFVKIIQSSYLFYALAFLVVFALSFNHINWVSSAGSYVLLPFLFFYFARFIALYVVAKPPGSLINLYLFSYLCVIEIIPLIVSMKFAL